MVVHLEFLAINGYWLQGKTLFIKLIICMESMDILEKYTCAGRKGFLILFDNHVECFNVRFQVVFLRRSDSF